MNSTLQPILIRLQQELTDNRILNSPLMVAAVLALGLTLRTTAAEASPELIGQWTFEPDREKIDTTSRWGNLILNGNASIENGQLHIHGNTTTASGWANAQTYSGKPIREKTLVSWLALDNLDVRAGSAMTIDNINGDNFDAIVYAERQAYRWMAGSSYFIRTQDIVTINETSIGQVTQMAISYRNLSKGRVEITLCRNGVQIGQYTSDNMYEWNGANAEIIFGMRHTMASYNPGAIEGRIEEARIYAGPMTCAEVGALHVQK